MEFCNRLLIVNLNSVIDNFHIFSIDIYVFSLQICRCSLSRMVKKCRNYYSKGSQRSPETEHLMKKFSQLAGV